MMLLTNINDDSIIVSLADESEIETRILELEGRKTKVIICADTPVEIVRSEMLSEKIPDSNSLNRKFMCSLNTKR